MSSLPRQNSIPSQGIFVFFQLFFHKPITICIYIQSLNKIILCLNFNRILYSQKYLLKMGGCASGVSRNYIEEVDKDFLLVKQKLTDSQLTSMSIIFKDIASRDSTEKVNIENFQLFFHKNGFWGERLFKQFDLDKTRRITEKQFIKGVVRIFKTSEEEKIRLLYHFFEKEDKLGISFDDFIVVLYNYPKSDLKQIFNDQQFVDTEIKKKLVEIQRVNHDKQQNQTSQHTQYRIQGSDNQLDVPLPSAYGFKGIVQDLRKKQSQVDKTCINLNVDGKNVEVKTSNIQHLVKKFARKLFKQYNINERTGRLIYEDFKNWIGDHKNLYINYYDGFHPQIWQTNMETMKPKYLSATIQKQSMGKMQIGQIFQTVHLYYLDSTIIVTKDQERDHPLYIICLDGLCVKRTFDKDRGFGIQISHRDGFYTVKMIYLKNQQVTSQWMELLKFYKGISVQHEYEMGQKIGTGKFSIVYACVEKRNNKQFAMKVIESQKLDHQAKNLIAHETSIMAVLNHPLLVSFKESIQTKTHLYIITQLVKGKDLFEYVREYGAMKEVQAAKVIRQLIMGVKHLHEIGIVHRDLKPQNIMVVFDKRKKQIEGVKIIDFGFANYKAALGNLDAQQLLAGTPNYIAPEILKNEPITEKIDNFAIGSIIYFVLSSTLPFNGHNITQMLQKTMEGAYNFDRKCWRSISDQAKDLIDKLLQIDPNERITLQQALKHEWFRKTHTKTC